MIKKNTILISSFILLFLQVGCAPKSQKIEITNSSYSISEEKNGHQILEYSYSILYPNNKPLKEESFKPILASWVNDLLVSENINSSKNNNNERIIVVEGEVVLDSNNLNKDDIQKKDSSEKIIKGFTIEDTSGSTYEVIDDTPDTKIRLID